MNNETMFLIILGVMLLISGVQSVELIKISEKISAGTLVNGDSPANAVDAASFGMDSVPDMVGGC
ncbi:MAG: hypothetical protein HY516_01795 [Candidatus Aenigmarchaeota archaeon]|nr:hypothetical protein [Candidatus Aenigmarchaeota archaeon]